MKEKRERIRKGENHAKERRRVSLGVAGDQDTAHHDSRKGGKSVQEEKCGDKCWDQGRHVCRTDCGMMCICV